MSLRKTLLLVPLVFAMGAAPPEGEITEITLRRTPCFGSCPVDRIVLHSDGTVDYYGERFAPRQGHFKGRLRRADFERLSKLVVSHGFFDLKPLYYPGVTDQPGVETTVVRGGKATSVNNNGEAGPLELWALEKAIQGTVADIKWAKAD